MSTLRSDLIRLAASSTPEVRKALLPVLAKSTTHLENPEKPGFDLCGERSSPKTTAAGPRDTTCHYCKQAWEKAHGGLTAALRAPKRAATLVPVIVDQTWGNISTILVDANDAREALKGVMTPDRLNVMFPTFGRSMTSPVKLLPKELIALGKAGLLKTAPKVNPQRAYDKLLDAAVRETRDAGRDYEQDLDSDPDWLEMADATFSGHEREFAPLMKELGLRRSDVVMAIAEAAAG